MTKSNRKQLTGSENEVHQQFAGGVWRTFRRASEHDSGWNCVEQPLGRTYRHLSEAVAAVRRVIERGVTARTATTTSMTTTDGLTIYDLDPAASELWAVAGPAGVDPSSIDPDSLPAGFRWLDGSEWERCLASRPYRA